MSAETSYIATGPYQDIISGVQLILSFSDGVVKLTGPSGCGRTRLLQELQLVMQAEKQRTILFIPPPKSVQELHNTITRTFSLGADVSFRKALTRFLSSKPRDQQALFLLIDDADSMDDETMSDLILLREVKTNTQGLVSLVLCGSPQLNARLAAPMFAELAKDIILNYELPPLDRQGLAAFCKDVIAQHKLGIPVPAGRTLDKLLADSGGLPGKVLQLLPGIVDAPEPAPEEVHSAAIVSPTAQAAKPGLEVVADGDAETDDAAAPLISSKLRKALYGGAAMAASVAAIYLLYPVLSPMLPKPETTITSSTPAAPEAPITEAPVTELPVAEAQTASVAEVTQTEPAVAETAAAAVTAPEPAPVTEPAQVATLTPPEPVAATAPLASTTVSLVPALPTATQQDASPAALEALVKTWLTAWQNKDLDQYFQAYHTDFAPLYQSTRAAWRDNRLNSISRPAAISIAMEEFSVNGHSSVGTHVSFWMEYHTATYADRTLKELVIGHDLDGSLRILQEINRDVTTLTPRDFVPGPDISVIASATPAPATQPTATAPAVAAAPAASGRSSAATRTQIGPPVQIGSVFTQAATATTSSPGISEAQTADISNFLGSWLDSWQHQDIDAYFAHYHPDFKSGLHASRDAWQQDRNRKIRRPLAIQIHLLNLQVMSVGTQDSELELQMEYHSTYYADRTVKALRLARGAAGQWLIIEERNQQVETLPLSRLIPGNSITMRGGINTIIEHAL